MRLDFPKDYQLHGGAVVICSHDDKTVSFDMSFFQKIMKKDKNQKEKKLSDIEVDELFVELNQYWAHLPSAIQSQIFDCYYKIYELLARAKFSVADNADETDCDAITYLISEVFAVLFEYHDTEDVMRWMTMNSNIVIPSETEFQTNPDNGHTAEKTYGREDYRGLVALSLALRAAVPVWSAFNEIFAKEMGTDWKEYFSFQMLNRSRIYNSRPMERLTRYINALVETESGYTGAIFGGISSEDFPIWVLSNAVIRKVAVSDIRGVDPTTVLVKNVWRHVTNKVGASDSSFIGNIKKKHVETQNGSEESNVSKLEGYKAREELVAGNAVLIEVYLDRPLILKAESFGEYQPMRKNQGYLCFNDPALIDDSATNEKLYEIFTTLYPIICSRLAVTPINEAQIVLMQWTISNFCNHKGLNYINKAVLLKVMAVVVSKLWYAGHHSLAILACGIPQNMAEANDYTCIPKRHRIVKESMDKLDSLFPYDRKVGGKKSLQKQKNAAVLSIEALQDSFSKYAWIPTIPQHMLDSAGVYIPTGRYAVEEDIKNKLANLVISIAERKF